MFAWYALRTKLLAERLGYTIPRNVFGPGLSIAHIGTITVNGRAVVGARCRIHQGVTIGSGRGYPAIGDDVFLGPNSMVLGAKVGDRVEVRPGAVVITDVPNDVHVAGVPARILARRPRRHRRPGRPAVGEPSSSSSSSSSSSPARGPSAPQARPACVPA